MNRSIRQYLSDMLEYVTAIENFTNSGREAFMQDQKTQFAVIRAYEVIGEIAKRLPGELLATQPEVEWQDIKEFRDFLAHNYERIHREIVWGAVDKLPVLRNGIELLLSMKLPDEA